MATVTQRDKDDTSRCRAMELRLSSLIRHARINSHCHDDWLEEQLLSSDCLDAVESTVDRLPASFCGDIGFEIPLFGTSGQGGFALPLLPRQWPVRGLSEPLASHPQWRQVQSFVTVWQESMSPLSAVSHIWLEFDKADSVAVVPEPCLFFGCSGASGSRVQTMVLAGLESLGIRPTGDQRRHLSALLTEFEPWAGEIQVGAMLSRPEAPIRVCLLSVPADGLLQRLELLGVDTEAVREVLPELAMLGIPFLGIDLDVADRISAKIGLEINLPYSSTAGTQRSGSEWRRLLAYFTQRGWCTPRKQAAVQNWPGGRHAVFVLSGLQIEVVLLRSISHLKITCTPGQEPLAKVYLWVRWQ